MGIENEMKIVFAKFCPLLVKEDPGNLVSVHFDALVATTSEAYCNHTGVPRVERQSHSVKFQGKPVAACDGCEEFMQGFEKPLENSKV